MAHLWSGRFDGDPDAELIRWGASFAFDRRLFEDDVAGSLAWAGLANTYFWIDRKKGVGGVIMTQILPFADPTVLKLYDAFERKVYGRQAAAA